MGSSVVSLTGTLANVAVPIVALSVGLGAGTAQATWLWRERSLLARSLLATLILVPIATVLIVRLLPVTPELRAGLIVVELSVGPVMALNRLSKGKGQEGRDDHLSYALGLNLTLLLLSIIYLPIALPIVSAIFNRDFHISVGSVVRPVFLVQVLPLLFGLALVRFAPRFAQRAAKPVTVVGNVLFALLVVVVLLLMWRPILRLGVSGLLVTSLVAAVAILIGHALGGPEAGTRRALAFFSAMKFPLLAILISSVIPGGKRILPVVIAYLLVSGIALTVYGAVTKATRGGRAATPRSRPAHAGV